ncbi:MULTISPECIES: hypothetical protein [unclassified Tolypothrix]|uniref:hypothetical protein n=1 Tax=unclassified Tolypothrix TaxID=2649714 RepID=UPI0005EAB4E5|nr:MULTISPECIES: hypothetical protein [unclassified Tolypothrix]EKE99415.1 hypothetical protein FDUTEX481_09990 [Tolypothrix sp. PCC 7601]UYD36785.1 hypothetical protein HG267_14285 [Tolypothrix sp. PCC 7601]
MGIRDWGLGTGDWGLGIGDEGDEEEITNVYSPLPITNYQSAMPHALFKVY